jgi:hypothetical protein
MTLCEGHSPTGRSVRSVVCWSGLAWVLGGSLLGCGASPVRAPLLGSPETEQTEQAVHQHTLAVGYSSLCELRNSELRCIGLHVLVGMDRSAWVSHGTGYDGFFHDQVATCGFRAGRHICWSDLEDADGNAAEDPSMPLCSPRTFSDRTDLREIALMEAGGCARSASGDIDCWGTTRMDESADPVRRRVVSGAESMSVRDWGGCAITGTGVVCWGAPSITDSLAEGDSMGSSEPRAIDVPDAVQVVAGGSTACARTRNGQVYCWGVETHGELGRGTSASEEPLAFPGLRAVDLIGTYAGFCARSADGRTFCWGHNADGQLGLGHTHSVNVPTHVPALDGALEVAMGDKLICARFQGGELRCAGDFAYFVRHADSGSHQPELSFTALPTHDGQPFTPISFECGVSYLDSDDYDGDGDDYGGEDFADDESDDED